MIGAEQPAGGVRVRFAPSPTGFLHVGNARTALFNWLAARHCGGSFLLRIEDTDPDRSRREYENQLKEDLRWLGLDWDEGVDRPGKFGPYRQSDRYDIYRRELERMLDLGKAYRCFCSEEEIEQWRSVQVARGELPRYSGKCRGIPPEEAAARGRAGESCTVRLRVRTGVVGFEDLVFGRIEVATAQIGDPVIARSDGSPTYNFSCVVDDVTMEISHVIRGEGHLSNTPRQVLIYEALGASPPDFAHLSTVLGPDGGKLSKRHGAASLGEFREEGYLAGALVNYLALLGWSPLEEGREIMPLEEIARQFDLSRVSKSPAIFDRTKLDWMNRSYIGRTSAGELLDRAAPYFEAAGLIPPDPDPSMLSWLTRVIDALRGRVDRLGQLPRAAEIVYGFKTDPPSLDEDARSTLGRPEALAVAREFARRVESLGSLTPEVYRTVVGEVKAATGRKGKHLFHPIRAALTGQGSGLELERLIPLYEEGSRLGLPQRVMSCRERLRAVLDSL